MDEYTPLEARVNHDGTVDVLIDGTQLPGGSGLTMESLLQLLARFAAENGKLLMTTTHPNGNVTRDLVSETGEVEPFYPDARGRHKAGPSTSDPAHEQLLLTLKQRGRRVGYPDIVAAPAPAPQAPATTRVKLGEGAIQKFDVEKDVKKALAPKKPQRSSAKTMILALAITVLGLGALAVGGWMFLSGGDFGPLTGL